MDIQSLFSDKSELYARARPQYPRPLFEWLASVCPGHQAVLDVGCGSGQAARDLAHFFETVHATDISHSQIAQAPVCRGVTFSVQPAEATRFPDDSFDAVCVAQALHWFDHRLFWPEVRRVLKPKGLFVAWGYTWPHVEPAIDAVLAQSFFSRIEPYWASQNRLLWEGYKSVLFPFEPLEVPDIKMKVSWSAGQFFAYLHSWSATRRCMAAEGDTFFRQNATRVTRLWGGDVTRSISMDFVLIAGRLASPV